MANYFARTIHGVEQLVLDELCLSLGATRLSNVSTLLHRTVRFSSDCAQQQLLELKSIDDLFLEVGELNEISHQRVALIDLSKKLAVFNWADAARYIGHDNRKIDFSVTASFVGKRNYNRWELADTVKGAVLKNNDWTYIDTRLLPAAKPTLHVRLILEHQYGLVGLRIANNPLYQRAYKKEHAPGSLHPPMAYILSALAQPKNKGGVFLDCACGVGTIPIEAHSLGFSEVIGIDVNEKVLEIAKRHADMAIKPQGFKFLLANFNALPFSNASIDAIASDLPWNNQTELVSDDASYAQLTKEISRVLKPGAKAVLMIEDPRLLEPHLAQHKMKLLQKFQVSLFGRHPTVLIMKRCRSVVFHKKEGSKGGE